MTKTGIRVALGYESGLRFSGGISRYARELYRGLSNHPDISAVSRFADCQWITPETELGCGTEGRRTSHRQIADSIRSFFPAPLWRTFRDYRYSTLLTPDTADVYHEPNYALRATRLPAVVTVHDLGVFLHPGLHPTNRVHHLTHEIPLALARANHIVALSNLVKGQIIETFGTNLEKISVIPIGLNPIFHSRTYEECSRCLQHLGLSWRQYILFVGTLEPRKNLELVLKSLYRLPQGLTRHFPLVVVGGEGWRNESLKAELDVAVSTGRVILIGTASDEVLAQLYSSARGVVFPSIYEGQGLPALEAAASGTPVLISDGSAMEEQVGGLALSVPASDEIAIADGIRALVEDEALHHRALAAAEGLRALNSMQRTVSATIDVYRRVINR